MSSVKAFVDKPDEWQSYCLRDACSVLRDGTHLPPPRVESGPLLLSVQNMRGGKLVLTSSDTRVPWEFYNTMHKNWQLAPGDVLLAVVGATIGKACRVPASFPAFTIQRSTAVLRGDAKLLHTDFLFHYVNSHPFQLALRNYANQTAQPGIYLETLGRIEIPVPASRQQKKIARILTTLDNLIEKTEALIAKYQAIKQGMMHDLFTRGVDSSGQLRPTHEQAPDLYDVDGDTMYPKSWERSPLRDYADVAGGITLGRKLDEKLTVQLPYLRVANVQDGYLDLTEMKTVPVLKSEVDRYLLQPGDVVMTEGGDFDKLGRGTVWEGQISPCLHQNHVFRVRPHSEELNSAFLSHLTGSAYGRHYFLMCAKQTTNLASINATQVKSFPLICPTPEEQAMIVERIAAIDGKIGVEQRQVSKLRSMKSGLMQDLLTGKVRVKVDEAEEVAANA